MISQAANCQACRSCGGLNAIGVLTCAICGIETAAVHLKDLRELDRRRHHRHRSGLLGAVITENGMSGQHIYVENVSLGGVRFRSSEGFEHDEAVRLLVPLNGERFVLKGLVRHSRKDALGFVNGAEFHAPESEFVERFQEMCRIFGAASELVFV